MRTALSVVLASSFLLACDGSGSLSDTETPTPTAPEEVELTTDDGLTISGTYQEAVGASRGPGLLLLHQFQRDRHDFDVIWDELHAAGYSLLAIDFRSHGLSDDADVNIQELLSDRDQLVWDVSAGLDFLDTKNLAVGNELIGVVGLSVGGNMAIVANHNTHNGQAAAWKADAIVTVSARKDRAEDLAGDNSLTLRNGLYVAGADESIQAEAAVELEGATLGDRESLLVEGSAAHGAELLAESAVVRQRLATWFSEVWSLSL